MQDLRRLILLLGLNLMGCTYALGEVVVVVDAKSELLSLTQDEAINIFLGRHRKFPTGSAALPVDQPVASALRTEFYRKLVGKELTEINAYWARVYFSGKTNPPLQAASASEVVGYVLGRQGGIGYMERNQVDARVRIVLSFP